MRFVIWVHCPSGRVSLHRIKPFKDGNPGGMSYPWLSDHKTIEAAMDAAENSKSRNDGIEIRRTKNKKGARNVI